MKFLQSYNFNISQWIMGSAIGILITALILCLEDIEKAEKERINWQKSFIEMTVQYERMKQQHDSLASRLTTYERYLNLSLPYLTPELQEEIYNDLYENK